MAVAETPIFDIPKIDGVMVDGNAVDWSENGFHVDMLAGESGEVREPKDCDAKFRLGWDERGLLVLLKVRDDQIAETNDPRDLFQKDSVELFFGEKVGSSQFFQVMVGTGADPKFPKGRTVINDRRTAGSQQKLEAETACARTADGYVVEARLPWSDLGITPKMGMETAFQLCVNDVDGGGPRLTLTWFPSTNTFSDSKAMYRLRLATKASPEMGMAARASLDQGRPRVDILAAPDLAGQKVTVTSKGEILATAKFEAASERARATFLLPRDAQPEVSCANAGSIPVDLSGLDEGIAHGLLIANPIFNPSVFSGENFPSCSFAQPSEIEKLLGKCVLTTTFYDADYHEVKTATKPGRYGAIVEVKTGNGRSFKRFVTLYRAPQGLNWDVAKLHMQSVEFPAELGLDPAVVSEHAKDVDEFFQHQVEWGISQGSFAATLFAALSETKPGEALARGRSPFSLNQKWWYELKKQTGNLRNDYRVFLPATYNNDPQKKWPLVLFLHGSGHRGYDINIVQPPEKLTNHPDLPFIIIAPQCSPGEWWSPLELNDLLDRIEAKYRVDTDREYLTGASMGGFGAWTLAADYPQRFAAVVPVCGGGDPEDAARLKNTPIWVFHGGKDRTVPIQRSQEMVDALKKIGGNVKFTIFPEAGHNSWSPAYATPELYTWLLQQHRVTEK